MLILAIGLTVGIGIFTFSFADGLSYLANDAKTCVNCHIMQPVYNSWQKSPHSQAATCQQCHISHQLIEQYIQKASQGLRHAYAFTFTEPEINLKISKSGYTQTLKNCVKCHQDLFARESPIHNAEAPRCLMCHNSVHH